MESTAPDPDLTVNRVSVPREFMFLAASLPVGLLLVPLLIWVAGHYTLGSYAHGGAWMLFTDYVKGLATGSPIFWAVALGPYLIVLLLRLLRSQLRPRA